MDMYSQWLKEYKGKEILKSDRGFIIYSYVTPKIIYLEDIYVKPENRSEKHSIYLAQRLVDLALENNVNQMITSLCPTDEMFQRSYKNTMDFGFKISHVHNNLIILKKDLV